MVLQCLTICESGSSGGPNKNPTEKEYFLHATQDRSEGWSHRRGRSKSSSKSTSPPDIRDRERPATEAAAAANSKVDLARGGAKIENHFRGFTRSAQIKRKGGHWKDSLVARPPLGARKRSKLLPICQDSSGTRDSKEKAFLLLHSSKPLGRRACSKEGVLAIPRSRKTCRGCSQSKVKFVTHCTWWCQLQKDNFCFIFGCSHSGRRRRGRKCDIQTNHILAGSRWRGQKEDQTQRRHSS